MDENFLIDKDRALRLLELMEEHGKSWFMHIFSSADILRRYTMKQLVGLGVTWVWIGLEGKDARYRKLAGADTRQLVRSLQSHGIRVLGSSIIGLEDHTPDNIDEVIDYCGQSRLRPCTSSCSTRRYRARRCTRNTQPIPPCISHVESVAAGHSRPVQVQFSSSSHQERPGTPSSCCGPSIETSR